VEILTVLERVGPSCPVAVDNGVACTTIHPKMKADNIAESCMVESRVAVVNSSLRTSRGGTLTFIPEQIYSEVQKSSSKVEAGCF